MTKGNLLQASIIGIGSELTSGQILNKNGHWISRKCEKIGIQTRMQLVVPDETALMKRSLQIAAAESSLIFVTGGLGPTSDDFTRDVVADFLGLGMTFDPDSWKHIEDRLKPRGITVKEIQRQQCYFPVGAKILKNRMGTANGFYIEKNHRHFWILPGPPKEIEAIWDDFIAPALQDMTHGQDVMQTQSWDMLGLPESEIAEKVEALQVPSTITVGYRVHLPYVELKFSAPKSVLQNSQELLKKVELLFSKSIIARNGEDVALKFVHTWNDFSYVTLQDEVCGVYLLNRLLPYAREFIENHKFQFGNKDLSAGDLNLTIKKINDSTFSAGIFDKKQDIHLPYSGLLQKERGFQYVAEMAILYWLQNISKDSV